MPRLADGLTVRVVPPSEQTIRVVPVTGPTGPPGPDGASGYATAAVNITTGHVLALTSVGAVPADPSDPGHRWAAAAIATTSALAGDQVAVTTAGRITEAAWNWTPGSPLYAGPVGAITDVPPVAGWLRVIGHAETPTSIWVHIHQPITLA